jgi:hypothetical protein
MMVKFTNANKQRLGDPLYINREWIVSVFEENISGGSLATVIYGGPGGERWFVEEGLSEVIKIINEGK